MSQLLLHKASSISHSEPSLGLEPLSACWSPLAEREHRVICTTSDIVGAVPPHMHARHHFGVMERGIATVRSEGRQWAARTGDLIWHPPLQLHSISSEYCRCLWVALDEHIVDQIVGAREVQETRVFTDGVRAARFVELHRRLERGAVTQSAASMLGDLIASVPTAADKGLVSSPLTPQVERCRLTIRNGFGDSLRLSDLAQIAGMSLFHLVRIFAHVMGVPPHTYLLHLRVAWAQTLLRRGLAGSRAAYEVGFSDQSHCIRVHRRLLGVSPFAVAALERELPVVADGFARMAPSARRAAASIWRS